GPRQDPARVYYLARRAAILLTPFSPSSAALAVLHGPRWHFPLSPRSCKAVWACHLKVDPTSLWAYCRQDSDSRQSK
ncbi:hypothetical protein FIBSPDRAFT_846319, partial [Athelia psychrophila]